MTQIARFNPFRGLGRFEPFGREIEDLFKGFFLAPVPFNQISAGPIRIDVTEDDKSLSWTVGPLSNKGEKIGGVA
jgi:hypothetical protein